MPRIKSPDHMRHIDVLNVLELSHVSNIQWHANITLYLIYS